MNKTLIHTIWGVCIPCNAPVWFNALYSRVLCVLKGEALPDLGTIHTDADLNWADSRQRRGRVAHYLGLCPSTKKRIPLLKQRFKSVPKLMNMRRYKLDLYEQQNILFFLWDLFFNYPTQNMTNRCTQCTLTCSQYFQLSYILPQHTFSSLYKTLWSTRKPSEFVQIH